MLQRFALLSILLFVSSSAYDGVTENSLEQFAQDLTDYDTISMAQPIKPIPLWQQWLTMLADTVMTKYDENQECIRMWCKGSTRWIALQIECLKQIRSIGY